MAFHKSGINPQKMGLAIGLIDFDKFFEKLNFVTNSGEINLKTIFLFFTINLKLF